MTLTIAWCKPLHFSEKSTKNYTQFSMVFYPKIAGVGCKMKSIWQQKRNNSNNQHKGKTRIFFLGQMIYDFYYDYKMSKQG